VVQIKAIENGDLLLKKIVSSGTLTDKMASMMLMVQVRFIS